LTSSTFDVLLGKHGDHIGGEREAVQALLRGEVDAACLIDANYLGFTQEGILPPGSARVLERTAHYDHCNFTVFQDAPSKLTPALSGASSGDVVFGPEGAAAAGPRRVEAVASWTYGWLSPARVSS
jgi:hypothetical protein